jgi:hypothetical protein
MKEHWKITGNRHGETHAVTGARTSGAGMLRVVNTVRSVQNSATNVLLLTVAWESFILSGLSSRAISIPLILKLW